VVYDGPSRLNGDRIVAIVTGLSRASQNAKTGEMAQLWILATSHDPVSARHAGADEAICGHCAFRPAEDDPRRCYVNVGQAPASVYRAWTIDRYPTASAASVASFLAERSLPIRLGAYGDPAALPVRVLRDLTRKVRAYERDASAGSTGYTHQWRRYKALSSLVMASCDNPEDVTAAVARGYRTFRVRGPEDELLPSEIMCPASDEAGNRTTCAACQLCDGSRGPDDRRKNIAIIDHGPTAARKVAA